LITLIAGTLIAISASSWLSTWIGLEINLLSLIPLIKSHNNKYSAESTIKYFITQTIASTIFLFSVIILIYFHNIQLKIPGSILITTALLIKLGAAPFHFWLPEVIRGLNWEIIYIILTWQKNCPNNFTILYFLHSHIFINYYYFILINKRPSRLKPNLFTKNYSLFFHQPRRVNAFKNFYLLKNMILIFFYLLYY